MNDAVGDFDAAEMHPREIAQEFVVIAGNIDDAAALARLAQQLLHDIIAALRPVPAPLQPPTVDDVADEDDGVSLMVAQEIKQKICLRGLGAEMHVGDEDRPEMPAVRHHGHWSPVA